MSVRVYSTLTGREDELIPLHPDGVLRMYVCGMTPKFDPHVGHARLFVAMDVIRRYLLFRGYKLKFVQNFTDVDDKIIQRAGLEQRSAEATAQAYIDSYFAVMDRLNVRRADEYPRVTTFMDRIIEFIAGLVESGHAYHVSETGDVWFSVASFLGYGKLSKRDLNSQLVAARKELEPGKREARDFALWKSAKPGEPSWPSPWGRGRPGWHIECSAMVRETLGDQIDIHGGGADLIFPHHENEIAQSESLTGKAPFARHWTHAGLVTIGGEKMAHSAENFFTLASLLERYSSTEVRYYLLRTHYRSPLLFAIESDNGTEPRVRGVEEARDALGRLRRSLGPEPIQRQGDLEQSAVDGFIAAMDSDFNTPDALAVVFDLAREINRRRDAGADQAELERGRRTLVYLLDVLGVDPMAQPESHTAASVEPYIELALDVRRKLREIKQWALADEVRDRLKALGVIVEDKPGGETAWRIEHR
ncbi:MAG: cysteine--tRNA ligase [Chloroflexota bacterium]|nr:cysteine--tRNA ligase [Chloroflexota bacterium]